MEDFPDFANLANARSMEDLYRRYKENPTQVDASWRGFFEGMDFAANSGVEVSSDSDNLFFKVYRLVHAYRRYGHLKAQINPLSDTVSFPEELALQNFGLSEENLTQTFPTCSILDAEMAPLQEIINRLEAIYCQKIGFECTGLDHPELEKWLQEEIEHSITYDLGKEKTIEVFQSLVESEGLETFIHAKYTGRKRFSVEGGESIIPAIQELIREGSELGLEEVVIAMAHRGRINVLGNVMKKPYSIILHEFEEDYEPTEVEGSGDTSYHKGYSSYFPCGPKQVHVHLAANPSHLESVYPVAVGQTLAKQVLRSPDGSKEKVAGLIMHGDGALSSQGVIYETMQMYNLPGYSVGGCVHVVVNNQLGYTTPEEESRSTRYCTDIAKGFGFPVFHVNAEDPIACVVAAKLAIRVRQKFQLDVILDVIGYRKYGHSEGDEPSFTQPKMYEIIRSKKTILQMFKEQLIANGVASESELNQIIDAFKEHLNQQQQEGKGHVETPPEPEAVLGNVWANRKQPDPKLIFQPVDTSMDLSELKKIVILTSKIPEDFSLHPKLVKWVETRKSVVEKNENEKVIDWALAEHLAFGSLLLENTAVRLAGQDVIRGTFGHRHAAWIDTQKKERYFPLAHMQENLPRYEIINSPLSELASLGFEYGYSLSNPTALVLWEAQYGDFANAAQVIIDQYVVSGEKKWGRFTSLCVLLPHGYEGAGPEHSSARIERYLVLAADLNIQVTNLTEAGQFFHLLRRQAKRELKKPLIGFTPKSLLRNALSFGSLEDLSKGSFEEILDDPVACSSPKRLLFCSGKIYYDLLQKREEFKSADVVLIRIEQIYPLHAEKLKKIFDKYKNVQECFWVQEEPENMGAWGFLAPKLRVFLGQNQTLNYIGRAPSASPAVGSSKVHKIEKEKYLNEAFARS